MFLKSPVGFGINYIKNSYSSGIYDTFYGLFARVSNNPFNYLKNIGFFSIPFSN